MKNTLDEIFQLRLDTKMKLQLEEFSTKTGMSVAQIIRIAIELFFVIYNIFERYFVITKKDWHGLFFFDMGLKKRGGCDWHR